MPRYDRHSDMTGASVFRRQPSNTPNSATISDAAAALRQAELDSAQPESVVSGSADLESKSVDELHHLASKLGIPNLAQIVERDQLIAAIRQRM